MIDEGYIKYECIWSPEPAIAETEIVELNHWRSKLYSLGLIGEYDNGIGFGNLSIRVPNSEELIVSGTQTGGIAELSAEHYARVTAYDWRKNQVVCRGLSKASSETLTHGAIYTAEPTLNAVVHVHHPQLWSKLLNDLPTTEPSCAYGTPEMAREIIRLCRQTTTQQQRIVIMSGHEEGILTFGRNLAEAGTTLLKHFSAI